MTENLVALGATSLGIGTFVALALMFILLAPRQRTHQLLAIGAFFLALNYAFLQLSINGHNNAADLQLLLNLERLMAMLFLVEATTRLFGIIHFLGLENEKRYRWLARGVLVTSGIIILTVMPYFDQFGVATVEQVYRPDSLFPVDYFKYINSGIPFVAITAGAGLVAVLVVNLINSYLFYRFQVDKQAFVGSILYLLSLLATALPAFAWMVPWLMMAGGILMAHAVLTGTLFNPLREVNQGLAHSVDRARVLAKRLERTLAAAEAEVVDRTAELEKALEREKHLARELEHSIEVQSELNQLKSKIITNVSHEFRTPLTIIKSSSELLTEYHDRITEEKRIKYRGQISSQIAYLDELLSDVLFINDSDEDGLQPSHISVPFSELWNDLTHQWQSAFAKRAKLLFAGHGDEEGIIVTDPLLLEKIGSSLLSNAVKYSAPDPVITVAFACSEVSFRIEFQDNGIGIPAGEEHKIFDLFYRGTNVDNHRGMGLGLYSARKMVEALDGRVYVKASSAKGTTICTEFPLTPTSMQPASTAAGVLT